MNWSVAKIGTIYQKPAHAIGLSAPPTPPIGCVLDLAGLPEVGNKIYDRSPYGNHGAITGATWKRLPSGLWVLDFDGTDDVITGSDAALPSGTTARSVLMWVNLDVLKDYQAFFSYGTGANGQALMFTSDHAAGAGTDKLLVGRYGAGQTASTGSISASIWQLIGFTMDANLAIIHYINGVASGTDTLAGANTVLDEYKIGESWNANDNLNGKVALVRVYNRVLSALEIQNHFNQEKHLFGVW